MDSEQIFDEIMDKREVIARGGWVIFWAALSLFLTIVITLCFTEAYGYALYLGVPLTVGYIFGFATRPSRKISVLKALLINFGVTVGLCLLLLLVGIEGGICLIIIIVPLYLLVVAGFLIGRLFRSMAPKNYVPIVFFLLINPSCLVIDTQSTVTDNTIKTEVEVNAPVSKVWDILTHPVDYKQETNFFFKYGVNYPLSMKVLGRNDSSLLHCRLRNGETDLYISDLEVNKKMRFCLTKHVEPMKELSPYNNLSTPHTQGGYFDLRYGEFAIIPIDGSHCKVIATSAFSYRLAPAVYWNLWGDYFVSRMHTHVLQTIKQLSELENQ